MWHFIEELKRRKVIRVAVAYIVSAWVLLQAAELLASILELPTWAAKLVLVLLLIGFVPAMILAWAYDLTPDGLRADSDSTDQQGRAESGARPVGSVVGVFSTVLFLIAGAGAGYWYLDKDERWVRNVALPAIDAHIDNAEFEEAYALAVEVERTSPDNEVLAEFWSAFAWRTTILTKPPGARVYRRAYSDVNGEWRDLGTTPLNDIHIPFGVSLIRIESNDHEPVLRMLGGGILALVELPIEEKPEAGYLNVNPEIYELDTAESMPAGMVRVPGWDAAVDGEIIEFGDHFIGRYEVTNEEYQAFVDAGGYDNPDYWEYEFVADGRFITFEDAMALMKDKTGRAGPATWEAGTYPEGQGRYPVSGVSWYEAAAYAQFAGRSLPTVHHWRRALSMGTLAWQLPASNLEGNAVAPVGEYQGIGWTGTYDMVGNVREWCFNMFVGGNRAILGSGWDEASYMLDASVSAPHNLPPFDRSGSNGFRLAAMSDAPASESLAMQTIAAPSDPVIPEPMSDEVFAANLSNFDYDPAPLNPVIEEQEEFKHWTRYRISIDSSEGGDRLPIYFYLPTNQSSRYQTVLYWPGAASQWVNSIEQEHFNLDFLLRNGRAVAMPVMGGMYEKRITPAFPLTGVKSRNVAFQDVREFRRMIDYLETRPDVDSESFAYYGHSWGGRMGPLLFAVEPRVKVGVLNQAGINHTVHHDINSIHYVPRVHIPILQFNGRYDTDFLFETSTMPFFNGLATDPADKRHVIGPTGHFVSPSVVKGETLDWLDRYLGPAQ